MSTARLLRAAALGAVALFAIAAAGCDGRPKSSGAASAPEPKSGPAIAIVDLSDALPEIESTNFLGVPSHTASFDRFVRMTAKLAKDDDVKGVLVRFGSASFGAARAEEVGERLAALRTLGKTVTCHGNDFGNDTMMAAERGCSRIWISPAGDVETVGIALELVYFHQLLTEQLHLGVDFLQVGKFKGAEEPFTRDGPSDEARSTMTSMLGDVRAAMLAEVKKGRNRDDAVLAMEDGPYSPQGAKDHGLVDAIGFWDDALAEAKKDAKAVRDEVRFGHGATESDDALGDVVRMLAGSHGESAPVVIVRAAGSIAMSGGGGPLGGSGGITEAEMSRVLARVEKDDAIKAMVLRIDSPGGSALASDLIWHHLRAIHAKNKPIVVSVGDMAASGGYYIASAADAIFAEPTSIVGSIGVVSGKVVVRDALSRIGVHVETLAGNPDPKAAKRVEGMGLIGEWDDATKARVFDSMKGIYDLFLARVAEGRKTTPDKIAPFAEGRLFSGTQAKANGLVDEVGGLGDAIDRARSLAKLEPDAGVATIGAHGGLLESLAGSSGDDSESRAAAAATQSISSEERMKAEIDRVAPEIAPFVSSLGALVEGERTLVAVPYALLLR